MKTQNEIQKRGMITTRIQECSNKWLYREITQAELRLMAYVQSVLTNSQKIDIRKITEDECEILSQWMVDGWVTDGVTHVLSDDVKLSVSKHFWDAMCEIIWLGYVDLG